ncbi:hypothetical protein ACFQO4_15045 [Saliphagus sp. GCM10025334]
MRNRLPVVETVHEGDSISRDEIFTVLSNRRRRWVLHYLKQHDGRRVALRTLVDSISAWEYETPPDELPWKKRKRVYTALRQSHLPKLDDAGVIEYDKNRGEVELTDDAREVQMYLEYVPRHDIPWSQCYLGLSVVSGVITSLTWLSVYPFAELPGLVLSTVLVSMFAASSIVHTVYTRRNRLGSEAGVIS